MEHEISTEQMESLKALSDVNIKISEAKNLLLQLQEEETVYLMGRETKAMERIQKIIDESQDLVKEADNNHQQIKELKNGISDFVKDLAAMQVDFKKVLVAFDERKRQWEENINKQYEELAVVRRQIKLERIEIDNDKEHLNKAKEKLAEDQRQVRNDTEMLQQTIDLLKDKTHD